MHYVYFLCLVLMINSTFLSAMDINTPNVENTPLVTQENQSTLRAMAKKICQNSPATILLVPAAAVPIINTIVPAISSYPWTDCFYNGFTIGMNAANFLLIIAGIILMHKK